MFLNVELVNLYHVAQASSSSESETGGGKEISSLTNDGSDYLKVLNHVRINDTLQGPISVIRGILRDFKDKKLSFSKQELKQVEERLKTALTEFYQELRLLKNYRYQTVEACMFRGTNDFNTYLFQWSVNNFSCFLPAL